MVLGPVPLPHTRSSGRCPLLSPFQSSSASPQTLMINQPLNRQALSSLGNSSVWIVFSLKQRSQRKGEFSLPPLMCTNNSHSSGKGALSQIDKSKTQKTKATTWLSPSFSPTWLPKTPNEEQGKGGKILYFDNCFRAMPFSRWSCFRDTWELIFV